MGMMYMGNKLNLRLNGGCFRILRGLAINAQPPFDFYPGQFDDV